MTKTMDKKIKIWQVNWTEQVELNRIQGPRSEIYFSGAKIQKFRCRDFRLKKKSSIEMYI